MLGCGVVGTGVARILREEGALIAARTGLQLDIAHVIVRDAKKNRAHFDLPFHSDAEKAIDDPKTKIVVELMGGTDAAAKYVERALRLGKPVVTANKSLLDADDAARVGVSRCAGGSPEAGVCRGRSDDGRVGARCSAEAGDPRVAGV